MTTEKNTVMVVVAWRKHNKTGGKNMNMNVPMDTQNTEHEIYAK